MIGIENLKKNDGELILVNYEYTQAAYVTIAGFAVSKSVCSSLCVHRVILFQIMEKSKLLKFMFLHHTAVS
jgi:hypothetical protein